MERNCCSSCRVPKKPGFTLPTGEAALLAREGKVGLFPRSLSLSLWLPSLPYLSLLLLARLTVAATLTLVPHSQPPCTCLSCFTHSILFPFCRIKACLCHYRTQRSDLPCDNKNNKDEERETERVGTIIKFSHKTTIFPWHLLCYNEVKYYPEEPYITAA